MLLGVYDEEIEKQVIREEERAKAEANAANVVIDTLLDVGYSNEEYYLLCRRNLESKKNKQMNI